VIRRATPDDSAGLAGVHVASWQAAYRGLIDQAFLDSLDVQARTAWWDRALAREANLVHVGVTDGVVEGFCLVGASADEGWGEVYALYVVPQRWGTGMGHELLSAGERGLARAGFDRALLWVLDRNSRGRRFYEREGWALGAPFRVERIGAADVTEVRYEKALTPP
jgi:GNAT superfamily N-acetyltransferase